MVVSSLCGLVWSTLLQPPQLHCGQWVKGITREALNFVPPQIAVGEAYEAVRNGFKSQFVPTGQEKWLKKEKRKKQTLFPDSFKKTKANQLPNYLLVLCGGLTLPGYQTHPLSHSPSPGRTREKNVMENHVSQDKHRERSPQWDRRAWTAAAHREVNGETSCPPAACGAELFHFCLTEGSS